MDDASDATGQSTGSRSGGAWLAGNWVPFGLWAGVAVGAGRAGALYMMERAHSGTDLQARMRLATYLPEALVGACALTLLVAALARLAGRPRAAGSRSLARVLVVLGGASLITAYMAGWLDLDLSRAIGTATGRGRAAVRLLAGFSVVIAIALVVLVARSRARGSSIVMLAAPVIVAVLIPVGWARAFGHHLTTMSVRETVGSLIDAPREVVRAHEQGEPFVDVLCPSSHYKLDGADMRSLILPPPAEVRIPAPDLDRPGRLFGRVGLDRTLVVPLSKELPDHSVRLQLWVDDELAFTADLPIREHEQHPGSEWVDFAGEAGLELPPGSTLRLTTALLDPAGEEVVFRAPVRAGFGGLTIERREATPRTLSSPEQPNVVLIVMDTLRADRLSTYGYERPTSPNLDRLAKRGLVFEEAHSTASWTWPSTASILTGLQPEVHGVEDSDACYLADEVETLAEVAQRRGLTTAAWSGNPLIVPDKNFDQGFEFFVHGKGALRKSKLFAPAALEWIENTGDTRFFLYLHLVDPHAPAHPKPEGRALFASTVPDDFSPRAINEYDALLRDGEGHAADGTSTLDELVPADHQRWISDLYDAQVWTGDMWLGRVLDQLERSGLDDRTIVVFTSDHGEELFDHGTLTHGRTLYREVVHVPLVMAGPGIPAGTRVPEAVSNRHIAPTLARLMGDRLPAVSDALDLADLGADPMINELPLTFSTTQGWWNGQHPVEIHGLRRGALVLHVAPEAAPWGGAVPGPGELRLFDVRADPEESIDLSKEWDAVAQGMRLQLETQRADLAQRKVAATAVPAGEATLDTLRALGYIDDE